MPRPAEPIVHLEGVSKSYLSAVETTHVLKDVSLTLNTGDKASLMGVSGSGKSTLLSLIAGLLRPDSGTIQVDGVAIETLSDESRARIRSERIGIALQSDNLVPFLTARENVELAMGFGSAARRKARARAFELLNRFNVDHVADRRPREISGGEAQRVALAVALANDPALLLADEIVSQLDERTAGYVLADVLGGDHAVLYVTHDVAQANRVEHRYRIHDGRVEPR